MFWQHSAEKWCLQVHRVDKNIDYKTNVADSTSPVQFMKYARFRLRLNRFINSDSFKILSLFVDAWE